MGKKIEISVNEALWYAHILFLIKTFHLKRGQQQLKLDKQWKNRGTAQRKDMHLP